MLYTSDDTTAICCLASLNLEYYDEFKDQLPRMVADWSDFLDNVLSVFIARTNGVDKAIAEFQSTGKGEDKLMKLLAFQKVRRSVIDSRDIGLGVMGFHSLLQKKMIPFESPMARGLNIEIFRDIQKYSDEHQESLNTPCPMAIRADTHRRNIHTRAVAPTMSISTLCALTSSGIEPWMANEFVKKVPTGTYTIKNKFLEQVINDYAAKNFHPQTWIDAQWKLVTKANGSVALLAWMDTFTKDVFKTAYEIDQRALLTLAGDRSEYIDQGQSLNLFVLAKCSWEELYAIHVMAWKLKIKSLYYLRSEPASYADTGSKERKPIVLEDDSCVACT
jgi:ribonucleoside-diphosphate reductase alpha chain